MLNKCHSFIVDWLDRLSMQYLHDLNREKVARSFCYCALDENLSQIYSDEELDRSNITLAQIFVKFI